MSLSIFRGHKINETISLSALVKLLQFMEEEEEVNIIMLQLGPILYLLSYTERGHTVWDVIQSNEHRIYSRLTCGY